MPLSGGLLNTDRPPPWYSLRRCLLVLKKYSRFIGPGLMVSVAYMDPGNYSTAVAAGAAYQYKLLFSILISNCLAIFLQILAARLGAVTGLDLAANCRANLSPRLNLFVYILAEILIIATDLAEVVGTAIALNILFKLPLAAGVVVTVVDVLIVLMAYRPKGPLVFIRIFELFVLLLVAATVVCFGIELFLVSSDPQAHLHWSEVLSGFLPNKLVIDLSAHSHSETGLYLSLAILGATVMPHSLYLGSGLVQLRLRDFDIKNGHWAPPAPAPAPSEEQDINHTDPAKDDDPLANPYRPSIHAINDTMTYTVVELVISLFTVALFVNAAILIVAGATVGHDEKALGARHDHDHDHDALGSDSDSDSAPGTGASADLFTIYHQLSQHLSPTVGRVFALALLCSGQSAGIVCTLAGQMVSEGFLSWSFPPVIRRLVTRGLAIAPCFAVVLWLGRDGLARTLNASQVVLSLMLPVVTAPLIFFTCSRSIMRVPIYSSDDNDEYEVASTLVPTFQDAENDRGIEEARFLLLEPAIRLQELRKLHPCAGWEDDDEAQDAQHDFLNNAGPIERESLLGVHAPSYSPTRSAKTHVVGLDSDAATVLPRESGMHICGYKDYSNSKVTAAAAVGVWAFITLLNLYLIFSVAT